MIELTLPELISYLSTSLKVRDLIKKISPKEDKVHKAFKYAIRDTARRLQEKYETALGGNAESILLREIEPIFNAFEKYGHLSDLKNDLKEVHFENLPEGFYDDFKSFLIGELIKFTETRAVLHEYFKTLQLDEIHENSMLLPKMDQKLDWVVSKVDQLLNNIGYSRQTFQSIKHRYQKDVVNFIERELKPSSDNLAEKYLNKSLFDLIETNTAKRIVLLNYAGNGKSEELNHLAYRLSDSESIFEPILLNLGTIPQGQSLMNILNDGYPGWRYLKANLVLILDALDEVKIDLMDDIKGQILNISSLLDQSTIVVACRTNVYNLNRIDDSGYLTGFTHFELPPFSDQNVWHYLINRFNTNEAQEVLTQAKRLGLSQDLTTPFYLVRLSDYYSQRTSLPNSKKELFEWLIYQLKKKEKIKSVALGDKIEENEEELDIAISKVACLLQITDKNYLNPSELRKTVNNKELVELLKSCYLLDRGTENKWRFEHNNFKEYLAAKFMAQKGIEFIKSAIIIPEINKIMPGKLNTLGFLISYLDIKSKVLRELLEFIVENDPESLVRVERDKIDLPVREEIFLNLFQDAIKKEIYPRSTKFSTEDLGDFVSDSKGICKYLVDQVDEKHTKTHLDLSLYLLRRNSHWHSEISTIEANIRRILFDSADQSKKKNCIEALRWFDLYNHGLRNDLFSKLDMPDKGKNEALFYYLAHTNYVEDHLEFMISEVIKDLPSRDYKYSIAQYLSKSESFIFILNKLKEDESGYHFSDLLEDTLLVLAEKSMFLENIIDEVYLCFNIQIRPFSGDSLNKAMANFIERANSMQSLFERAVHEFLENVDSNSVNCIKALLNEQNLYYLLQEIKKQVPSLKHGRILRNVLVRSAHDDFSNKLYSELNVLFDNQLLWQKDPYQEALLMQVEFYFNRGDFIEQSKTFFSDGILTRRDLYDLRKFENEDARPLACREIIGRLIEDTMTYSEFRSVVLNDDKWDFIKVKAFLQIIETDRIALKDRESGFLKSWALRVVSDSRLEHTYHKDERGEWLFYWVSLYAASICEYYNLDLSHSQYLLLIRIDSQRVPYINVDRSNWGGNELNDSRILEYVITKVGESDVENEIIQNLRMRELVPEVRFNHLKFLRRREKSECLDFFIQRDRMSGSIIQQYLTWYLELGGDVRVVFNELGNHRDYEKGILMDEIIQRDKVILREYLINEIAIANNEEDRAVLIKKVLACEDKRGLSLMRQWVLENKRFLGESSIIRAANLSADDKLEILKELYLDSLDRSYGDDYSFYDRRSCIEYIVKLGLESKESFYDVQNFLMEVINKYPEMKILYGVIDGMEYDFYKNQSYSMDLNEAILLLS